MNDLVDCKGGGGEGRIQITGLAFRPETAMFISDWRHLNFLSSILDALGAWLKTISELKSDSLPGFLVLLFMVIVWFAALVFVHVICTLTPRHWATPIWKILRLKMVLKVFWKNKAAVNILDF